MQDYASNVYKSKTEEKVLGTVPCFSCGKKVQVMLPYIGCIYCEECMKSFSWSGGSIANSRTE